jgi:PAS domain S-box-containing protein
MKTTHQELQYTRNLIEAILDPLITIDVNGRILDVNEATTKATDKSRKMLIDTNCINYFVEKEKAKEFYLKVFSKGFVMNFPLTIMDGVLTDVLVNGSVYKNEQGDVLGAVMVARDITELKKIENELTETKKTSELAALKNLYENI